MEEELKQHTGRSRIQNAFLHKPSDRIPVFDVVNNPDVFTSHLGADNYFSDGRLSAKLSKKLGLDAVMVPVGSYTGLIRRERDWIADDRFIDRFGVEYRVTDTSWPLGCVVGEVPLDLKFVKKIRENAEILESDLKPIRDGVEEAHSGDGSEIAIFGGLRSSFSFLTISGGLTELSLMLYENPELLRELVKVSSEYWTEVGLRLIEVGVDALYVANDMGMNGSTMISPDHLREFFFPAFEEQCRIWKEAGGTVILHSCGNIMKVLPDLAEGGMIDGLNNLQTHAGMSLSAVSEVYGDRWTLIGNVDATTVMTTTHPEEIDSAVSDVIDSAAGSHGLIIATDHSFHKGIPPENIFHFIGQAKTQGVAYAAGSGGKSEGAVV